MRHIQYLLKWTPSLVLLCCLGACATYFESSVDSLSEPNELRIAYERAILSALETDPLLAVQLIDHYQRESDIFAEQEIGEYLDRATNAIIAMFNASIREERYLDSVRLYQSLAVMDATEVLAWSYDSILYQLVLQELQKERSLPALHAVSRIGSLSQFNGNQLNQLAELAATHNHFNTLARIRARTGQSRPTLPPRDFERMLTGLVTIWVDRGFRIENGVGIPERVVGSGFFVDANGYLLTNYHIISSEVDPEYEGYSRLFLQIPSLSNQRIPARVVGYDPILDIALLKAEWEPSHIFGLEPHNTTVSYGNRIFALGSPIGLQNSIASGVVSSPSRKFLQIGDALQIDAPVNPGNSGGPLVAENGSLIGVIFAGIQELDGINFAIPSHWIWQIIPQLYNPGIVSHAWVGLLLFESNNKIEVQYVIPGSPADMVGIKKGYFINKIANTVPATIVEAQQAIFTYDPNTLIELEWQTEQSINSGIVKLASRPRSPIEELLTIHQIDLLFNPLFGLDVQRTGRNLPPHEYVVQHVYPGSIADRLDIAKDDTFRVFDWNVDQEKRIVTVQVSIKQRTNSFSNSGVQMFAFLDNPNLI